MDRKEIMEAIKGLAKGQGFYGRVLDFIENDPRSEELMQDLEAQHFGDVVDLVLYLEQ